MFNKQDRSGIFYLLLIIVILQIGYFILVLSRGPFERQDLLLDSETQLQIDALKALQAARDTVRFYPFNPNYISDFKGYTLGMSTREIDRLHQFRQRDKFVNSALEFQQVTQVSDSLLAVIAPFFRFPEWVREKKASLPQAVSFQIHEKGRANDRITGDLNSATLEELKKVRGIGDKLGARILKFRKALGGFLVAEQLYDVYGLPPEVAAEAIQNFDVRVPPDIPRVNLNTASDTDLAGILYINSELASNIIAYREEVGRFTAFDDLRNIPGFPIEKIDRITLYLSL